LNKTIEVLKRDLQKEKDNSSSLKQQIEGAARSRAFTAPANMDATLASALTPVPATEDFASLEDENLRLREDLNASKEKVIELKKAAAARSAAWKNELQTITEELTVKQKLEEEVVGLKEERARMQEEVRRMRQQIDSYEKNFDQKDSRTRAEVETLQSELQQAREDVVKVQSEADEFKHLSGKFSRKVQDMEQELKDVVNKNSRLLELFLQHSERPLEAIRLGCQQIVDRAACPVDVDLPVRWMPNENDIQNCLVELVNILRFAEAVMEALDAKWSQHQQQHDQQHSYSRDGSYPTYA
jgi:predicted  nucleic acid-binding Zn-ribbon protein